MHATTVTILRDAARAVVSLGLAALLTVPVPGVSPNPLGAQQSPGEDHFTAEDVFDLEYVADPQLSPDGERIVYVRRFADVMTDTRYSNLWTVGFDGTDHRPLTTGKHGDGSPRWSPDGTRLLYVSDRSGSPQLHVRWMDTGEEVVVTDVPNAPMQPAWSPDGDWIAFTSVVPGERQAITDVMQPPGGAEWAPPARVIDRLVHRFDGVGELDPGYSHVFVVPAEGGTARQLSSGPYEHGGGGGRGGGGPVWAPDGRHILISANRRGDWEVESRDTEVWEIAVADGAMRPLTDRFGPDASPAVSPDGRRVAFTGYDDRRQGYQVTELYVMGRDGSGPRSLTAGLDRSVRAPRWAPDGSGVYFLYDDEGNTKVGFVDTDGSVRDVASDVGSGGSAYASGSYSVSGGGRVAYEHTTPYVPGDLAVVAPGSEPRVLTAVNEDLLGHKTLGEVEEVWYDSEHDGRPIQGWIIRPPDFETGRRYPLVLEIHGGPFANYGDRFDVEKQVMAAAGYVVLYTNPRGSTSYGEEFGNLIHHAYPGNDFYDLDSGVDLMVTKEYVDPEQLFITGGSGGGVLSSWSIGKTDRYRAAVVIYPVINWYSFALTSDIPVTLNKYWFPGPPWENPEHYLERSPISLVGNVTTPTMLITGEEDWRTPMSETDQYYQALKLQEVPTVLVKVPGEPHGIRERPSHFMQKMRYMVGWFDRYRVEARPATDGV